MHEEATSMSVPGSVAASTTQNENGTTPTVSVVTAEVELNVTVDNDNVDLQVPFSSNSGGNSKRPNLCHFMIHLVRHTIYAFMCTTNLFPWYLHSNHARPSAIAADSLFFHCPCNFAFQRESEFEREIVV